jgi:FkbM family methyltransferase
MLYILKCYNYTMLFDIGSNIGNWSLANVNLCNKIICVEASPITFKKLVKNCKHDKIILLNYAVCNNENDITFYQADNDVLSTINKDWLTNNSSRFCNTKYKEIICKTITIDKLIQQYGLPDLIKIDVEGGEYECILSLTQKIPLCFEWASEVNNITFNCIDYLFKMNYKQYYIQYSDNYTFRPNDNDYYDIDTIKTKLSNTIPKVDWGMIWCK